MVLLDIIIFSFIKDYMDSIEDRLSHIIYTFYLDEVYAETIGENIEYIYKQKIVKLFYGDENFVKIEKNNIIFYNFNFIKNIYTLVIKQFSTEFDCSNEELFLAHKTQIWIYIIYFLHTIYDKLYDGKNG